jgi:hypothetical protein
MALAPRQGILSRIPGFAGPLQNATGGLLSRLRAQAGASAQNLRSSGLLGALVGAANDAIGSDTYRNAVKAREERDAAMREQEQQAAYARLLFPGQAQPAPMGQTAQMGAPVQQPMAPMPEPAAMPGESAPPAVVRGSVRRPGPNPMDMASNYERAAQEAASRGDLESAMDFRNEGLRIRTQAQTAQQTERTQALQQSAALLAPALRVPAAQRPDAVRFALNDMAQQYGVNLPPEIEDILLSPDTPPERIDAVLQAIVNMADPEAAMKLQQTPFQRVDLGGRDVPFDPRTGTYGEGVARSIDPSTRFQQEQQNRREAMGNATQREIAMARIAADRAEAAARNAQGAEKLRLEAAALDLRRQEQALTRQWLQGSNGGGSMPGSAGITWGQ